MSDCLLREAKCDDSGGGGVAEPPVNIMNVIATGIVVDVTADEATRLSDAILRCGGSGRCLDGVVEANPDAQLPFSMRFSASSAPLPCDGLNDAHLTPIAGGRRAVAEVLTLSGCSFGRAGFRILIDALPRVEFVE